MLALCHTIRVDRMAPLGASEYSADGSKYEYQASSPDEKALVEAAARFVNIKTQQRVQTISVHKCFACTHAGSEWCITV